MMFNAIRNFLIFGFAGVTVYMLYQIWDITSP